MPNIKNRYENSFWRALTAGKAAEWQVFAELYRVGMALGIPVNVFPVAIDCGGIDALLDVRGRIFALAVQSRGSRIELCKGDTSPRALLGVYNVVVMSPCRATGGIYVADQGLIRGAIGENSSSIPISSCLELRGWLLGL